MNVLAVRLSSLGDVVLTLPVFENLRAARPGARLSVLVKARFADVFRAHPAVDEVLLFEDRGFWGWLMEIRRRRFDVYIDLHDTPRSRLWGLCSGAAQKVRYDKRAAARRALVWFKKESPALLGSVVDRYLECLEPLGVPAVHRSPRLAPPPEGEDISQDEVPWIGVAPGAAHATKRWLPERFAAAADRLARERFQGRARVALLGAAADAPAAEEVLRHLRTPARNFAGRTSVAGLLALLRRCALLLTNDSGAMHAACALGVPTAAVFGPTVEAFGFFPRGDRAAVVEVGSLSCRPCSLHGRDSCPEKHFRCMRDVGVDEVCAAAARVLK